MRLHPTYQLFGRNACLPQNGAQRSDWDRAFPAMNRNHSCTSRLWMAEIVVASAHMDDLEAHALKGPHQPLSSDITRNFAAHAATSTVSSFAARRGGRGAGWPSFRRASKQQRIASRAFRMASPWLRPHVMHSGNPGTVTMYVPPSSGAKTTWNRRAAIKFILARAAFTNPLPARWD